MNMPTSHEPMIRVRGLRKSFETLDATIVAADGIELDVDAGTITALTGPSGSGKSTLLHLIGALDTPDEGTITVDGTEITALTARSLPAYRRRVGFVFQRFNLIPTLSVLDNVLVPLMPQGIGKTEITRGRDLLEAVALEGRDNTLATRLSGGQQQRVAIARALVAAPTLLLADEPTGNLDSATSEEIISLLFALRNDFATTLLIATHDPALATRCDTTVHLRDGQVTHVPR